MEPFKVVATTPKTITIEENELHNVVYLYHVTFARQGVIHACDDAKKIASASKLDAPPTMRRYMLLKDEPESTLRCKESAHPPREKSLPTSNTKIRHR